MAARSSLRATIDRIERDEDGKPLAVLLFDDGQQLVLPEAAMPRGAGEGDVVEVRLGLDRGETTRRSDEIRRLQQGLYGG